MRGFYLTDKDDTNGAGENLKTEMAVVTRIDRALELISLPDQVALREETMKRESEQNARPSENQAPSGLPWEQFHRSRRRRA